MQETLTKPAISTAVPPPPRPVPPVSARTARPRPVQIALALAAVAWFLLSRVVAESAARGLTMRFGLGDEYRLIEAVCRLFLLVLGLAALSLIERRGAPATAPLSRTLGLPRRATALREWALGAAIGWGLAVAAILPMALARSLDVRLWWASRAWLLLAVGLLTLAVSTLAHVLGLYGYAFQRLIEAIGPTRASLLVVLLAALYIAMDPAATSSAIAAGTVAGILLCLTWLRSHGLWIAWGLSFAWAAAAAFVFGLPPAGAGDLTAIVDARAIGPAWLTGGSYGPSASLVAILFLLAAIPILIRSTSDYAWDYTRPPILPAGIEVNIPAPAAHSSWVDQPTPAPEPGGTTLVQIAPAQASPSTTAVPPPPAAGSPAE